MRMILVVCNGNMHRSVIAEECIKNALNKNGLTEEYFVLSRGLQGTGGTKPPKYPNLRNYPLEWSLTEPILDELDITIPTDKVSTPIDEKIVTESSLIIAMENGVLFTKENSLVRQFPKMRFKMKLFTELEDKADDIVDLYSQKDPAIVRREVMRIDSIVKTHLRQLLAWADSLTPPEENK